MLTHLESTSESKQQLIESLHGFLCAEICSKVIIHEKTVCCFDRKPSETDDI